MSFHVVIPARFSSSRLPGKPLADINGKSMIQRVYEQAQKSGAQSVTIATDDQRILDHAATFHAKAVLTDESHESGTDRIHEACTLSGLHDDDIVVNVQGDEPFIPPVVIKQVADLLAIPNSVMATLCTPICDWEQVKDPNVVKVVKSLRKQAIYFSRSTIPFDRDESVADIAQCYFRHLGIYAFKRSFLNVFSSLPVSLLERIEKLEQLRALENGYAIQIDVAKEVPPAGVDTQKDLDAANAYAKSTE